METRLNRNLGMTLLGIWLIATGVLPLLHVSFDGLGMLMSIVAIVAGALIIAGK